MPVESDVFLLQTDASGVGISGVLSVSRDGEELPVDFFSRQLKDAETRYSATVAVVDSTRHFEVYLQGRHFRVDEDHKALEGLFTSKVFNRRLTHWALFLQDFRMTIVYRPGRGAETETRTACHWPDVQETDVDGDVTPL